MAEEMTISNELAASLARLEEWARHSEAAAKKADADRQEMMQHLQEIAGIQKVLVSDMKDVKPVTDMIKSFRSKLTGAFLVLGIIGAVIWAAISFFKESILKLLSGA